MERRRLATARYEKGWSQEELAERVGVTRNTLSKWERGIVAPYPLHVHRLCSLLGKTAAELDLEKTSRKSQEKMGSVLNSMQPKANDKEYTLSRRQLLITLATLPTVLLLTMLQGRLSA